MVCTNGCIHASGMIQTTPYLRLSDKALSYTYSSGSSEMRLYQSLIIITIIIIITIKIIITIIVIIPKRPPH